MPDYQSNKLSIAQEITLVWNIVPHKGIFCKQKFAGGTFLMEQIRIFNNPDFGDVRTIIIDGESFKNNAWLLSSISLYYTYGTQKEAI